MTYSPMANRVARARVGDARARAVGQRAVDAAAFRADLRAGLRAAQHRQRESQKVAAGWVHTGVSFRLEIGGSKSLVWGIGAILLSHN